MSGLVILFLIAMILLCIFVYWNYHNTVYGYSNEIITPYNTGNDKQYCGIGERENCINIIPQNISIPINMIQGIK